MTLAKKGRFLVEKGFDPAFLHGPEIPEVATHIWEWVRVANSGRTNGGMASNPITWPDMAAFFGLMKIQPSPWEVRIFRAFDRAFTTTDPPEEASDD